MNEPYPNKLYTFPAENLAVILDHMKRTHNFIRAADTKDLCEVYEKLFPAQDGMYQLSVNHIMALINAVRDQALLELVDLGYMAMSWDDKTEQFVFSLTDLGQQYLGSDE